MNHYLKNLSVSQRLTHELLYVSPNNKCGDDNSHEHPGEDEAEANRTDHQENKQKCKRFLVSNFNYHQIYLYKHFVARYSVIVYTICCFGVVIVTHAISRFPPVLDRQPRVVGVAFLS